MSDHRTSPTPPGAAACTGPIAGFFNDAHALVQAGSAIPETIQELRALHRQVQASLDSLRQAHRTLRADPGVAACDPLRTELNNRWNEALATARRLESVLGDAIDGIQEDCLSMVDSVRELRAAVRMAMLGESPTSGFYVATSAIYRDLVARASRVRALLAGSEAHCEFGHIAFQVSLLTQHASDAFLTFLHLHAPTKPQ